MKQGVQLYNPNKCCFSFCKSFLVFFNSIHVNTVRFSGGFFLGVDFWGGFWLKATIFPGENIVVLVYSKCALVLEENRNHQQKNFLNGHPVLQGPSGLWQGWEHTQGLAHAIVEAKAWLGSPVTMGRGNRSQLGYASPWHCNNLPE